MTYMAAAVVLGGFMFPSDPIFYMLCVVVAGAVFVGQSTTDYFKKDK